VSYIFFPLSSILRHNASASIPDQTLENILIVLGILCESWWWDCAITVWDQIFKLCGAILGGMEGKGKGKDRDDETKEAAAKCLWSLLRERTSDEDMLRLEPPLRQTRLIEFQVHAQTLEFMPVLGQTINTLLTTADSHHMPLQRVSFQLLHILIAIYAPGYFVPSILPGVVSAMTKIALGVSGNKGWSNGDIVAGALKVMEEVIVKSIGDGICIKEGAVHGFGDIEDLAKPSKELDIDYERAASKPYMTARTSVWLRGTSSQLHIAINTLTPLVSHPTPTALLALSRFSSTILVTTLFTLPQSQTLLLSFLLSLSNSTYPSVSNDARNSLLQLLAPSSKTRHILLQTLIQNTRDNLTALPRLLLFQADAKIVHIAGLVEATCRLTATHGGEEAQSMAGVSLVSTGIGRLLGANGGIEKWGWSLLSVLEFANPPVRLSRSPAAGLLVEDDIERSQWVTFPEVIFKNVSSRMAHDAIARMFRSLGQAGGDHCLYSVDWFTTVGRSGRGSKSVAALWCACRLLEGVGNVSLDSGDTSDSVKSRRSKRLEKLASGLARSMGELWDEGDEQDLERLEHLDDDHEENAAHLPIEHVKSTVSIRTPFDFSHDSSAVKQDIPALQPLLHKALSLQLLSLTAGILQARFPPLLIHVLYPVLHSLVSPVSYLSSAAFATLNFVMVSTSYASIANLLLSNFDYALDAVSRRLTHRWLDVDAAKVLVILVRLVGSDIVQKAGDVVEECFDRLDEFHGYEIIVEGLVEVLGEVIKVVKSDEASHANDTNIGTDVDPHSDNERLDAFFAWFACRNHQLTEEDNTDYGLAPREAWGDDEVKNSATTDEDEMGALAEEPDPNVDSPTTPAQALTKQIVLRSMYFLTHGSSVIRARILTLLSSSVPVLPESALLPSVHRAWPFILNRLADPEPFVVTAASSLVEALATHVGSFMYRRIWDDVWPRFSMILKKLDSADATNALARRGRGAVGTESAHTHSHRLYRSLLTTMTAAVKGVQAQDSSVWQVIIAFRRFLHSQAHEELQKCARELYMAIGRNNEDAVWLSLSATTGKTDSSMAFMMENKWDIDENVSMVLHQSNPL
jgi:hypothetical protein